MPWLAGEATAERSDEVSTADSGQGSSSARQSAMSGSKSKKKKISRVSFAEPEPSSSDKDGKAQFQWPGYRSERDLLRTKYPTRAKSQRLRTPSGQIITIGPSQPGGGGGGSTRSSGSGSKASRPSTSPNLSYQMQKLYDGKGYLILPTDPSQEVPRSPGLLDIGEASSPKPSPKGKSGSQAKSQKAITASGEDDMEIRPAPVEDEKQDTEPPTIGTQNDGQEELGNISNEAGRFGRQPESHLSRWKKSLIRNNQRQQQQQQNVQQVGNGEGGNQRWYRRLVQTLKNFPSNASDRIRERFFQ
ncbi:hypothetical protein F5Y19DRAFT_472267 [Xylariaceae sp. FL1651]|nr:hypothetical protein F5Y19DRAFT_472267 [Xylariaceae sp. FL1651]